MILCILNSAVNNFVVRMCVKKTLRHITWLYFHLYLVLQYQTGLLPCCYLSQTVLNAPVLSLIVYWCITALRTTTAERMVLPRMNSMLLCKFGATRGVTVSTSSFLACHQYDCAGSSLAWGLNLWALVHGIF